MFQNYNVFFKQYRNLRQTIDKIGEKLFNLHHEHICCRKGCDLCCIDYNIFPIEFYSILDELQKNKINTTFGPLPKSNTLSCSFLKDRSCSIYPYRPIICRTHGLPLLFANNEGEWELSACELNFTNFEFSGFNQRNTFALDKFNSQLFMLNKSFIAEFQGTKYKEFDLIPIYELYSLSNCEK